MLRTPNMTSSSSALRLFEHILLRANPYASVLHTLTHSPALDPTRFRTRIVCGAGKASEDMARAVVDAWGDGEVAEGLVLVRKEVGDERERMLNSRGIEESEGFKIVFGQKYEIQGTFEGRGIVRTLGDNDEVVGGAVVIRNDGMEFPDKTLNGGRIVGSEGGEDVARVFGREEGMRQDHKRERVMGKIRIIPAGHPLPDNKGREGTKRILELIRANDSEDTLIVWCASGGGSALTGGLGVLQEEEWGLLKIRDAVQWLLKSGAPIEEVNAVRKHLCAAHAGRVGLAAGKSTVMTLVVSDIIGSPLHAIAGGPTTADPTTLEDCRRILMDLVKTTGVDMPESLKRAFFTPGGGVPETPKSLPANILQGKIVVDLRLALEAGLQMAQKEFQSTLLLTSKMCGEAKDAGKMFAAIATDVALKPPFAILAGGETTVTIDPKCTGLGGRNQELALSCAIELYRRRKEFPLQDEQMDLCILVAGSDGSDGPTPAAGACVTSTTIANDDVFRIAQLAMQNHDSYNFFKTFAPQAHLITGPTGTNVMDVVVICGVLRTMRTVSGL